ncbi:hypothetical protein [Aureimonas sp. N4]|uniref:hypothetical protein n=1 Tax=Aureimonas sp. N4 TaxID=1638165 RepID=UPI0007856404|nr:hypothetical protein [Aureimonas sp. N4]
MPQPTMTPQDFRRIQEELGLDDAQMAEMLGFESAQNMKRLKADVDKPHHRKIMPYTARLLQAYLDGYRPADWPAGASPAQPAARSAEDVAALARRLDEIEEFLKATRNR